MTESHNKLVKTRGDAIFRQQLDAVHCRTDRMFGWLMIAQWILAVTLAVWVSPRTWAGATSRIHIHLLAAVFMGGLLAIYPWYQVRAHCGEARTRYATVIAQLLWSILLIHLTGGRIETHFHVFGSLAFVAFYRDWRLFVPATVIIAVDHLVRGYLWPQSAFGVLTVSSWRAVEHAGWVVFECVPLLLSIKLSIREMRSVANQQAELEITNSLIEVEVSNRTSELRVSEKRARAHVASLETANGELHRQRSEFERQGGALAQRARLASLAAQIGIILTRRCTLREMLQACAQCMVDHLDAAFVRFWTLNEPEQMLELQASAGMYTHIDGQHGRVPVGQFKIGLIAQERKPHLSNEVIGDPRVGDQEWARREGMVAFAGHPLIVEGRLIGVAGLFARHKLPDETLASLAAVADVIAVGIERKGAGDALRDNEALLSSILDILPQRVFWKDLDGRFLSANRAFRADIGDIEFVGMTDDELPWKGAQADAYRACDQRVMESGAPEIDVIESQSRPDGSLSWLTTCKVPLRAEDGSIIGVLGTYMDITARKRAEEALRESEEKLRVLMEAMPQIVWMTRADGWTVFVNRGWTEFTGLAAEESFGLNWITSFHPDDQQQAMEAWKAATQTSAPYVFDGRLRKSDGSYRWMLIRGLPVRDGDGSVVNWLGTCTDIDELKLAQEASVRGAKLLATSNEALKQAESVARLGHWHYEFRTGRVEWSDQLFELHARPLAQGAPDFAGVKDCYVAEDARRLDALVQHAIRTGDPYTTTLRLRETTAGVRILRTEGRARRDPDGKIVELFGTALDVTDVVEREQALRTLQAAAEAANQAKSRFLANMSHEIRTPMTAILGFADRLPDIECSREDQLEAVEAIQRNARHLLSVINDILDISKIEAGHLTVERVACSPSQILCEVASTMRVRAVEKGIDLVADCHGLIPTTILSDPTRLRQILINLVGNAIKFTASGQVRLRTELEPGGENEQPKLLFEVRDTGIGLSPEQQRIVFAPFTQADTSTTRIFGGTGLGLAISKHLAEMLGGGISVDSALNQGSTFAVRIDPGPIDDVPLVHFEPEARLHSANDARQQPSIRLKGRVLLVDDGRDNRRLIALQLEEAGAEVTLAENGLAALALVRAQTIDLVLMDMQMPVMDGYAATAELRKRGETFPIIALTAHALQSDRLKCLKCGCTDYLSKPAERQALLEIVQKYLNGTPDPSPDAQTDAIPQPAPMPPAAAQASPDAATEQLVRAPLRSKLEGGPRVEALVREYIAELPQKVVELVRCLRADDVESLRRAVHKLKGSAGGYGFPLITQEASDLENELCRWKTLSAIASRIQALADLVRSVEGYSTKSEESCTSDC